MSRPRFVLPTAIAVVVSACGGVNVQHSPSNPYRGLFAEEIAEAGAESLYQLLESTRPAWLWAGGDPEEPSSLTRVLVYVDGRRAGDLNTQGRMAASQIATIHFQSPQTFFRNTGWMRDHPDVTGVLLVSTPRSFPVSRRSRIELGFAATTAPAVSRAMRTHFSANEFRDEPTAHGERFAAPDGQIPPMSVSARIRVYGPWTAELVASRAEAEARGVPDGGFGWAAVSNNQEVSEIAVLAGYRQGVFRVGVGAAQQTLDWTWSSMFCRCQEVKTAHEVVTGAAANFGIVFPPSTRAYPEARVSARYFPSRTLDEYRGVPQFEYGGLELSASLGFGFRF